MISGGQAFFVLIAIKKKKFWQVMLVFCVRHLHNALKK